MRFIPTMLNVVWRHKNSLWHAKHQYNKTLHKDFIRYFTRLIIIMMIIYLIRNWAEFILFLCFCTNIFWFNLKGRNILHNEWEHLSKDFRWSDNRRLPSIFGPPINTTIGTKICIIYQHTSQQEVSIRRFILGTKET